MGTWHGLHQPEDVRQAFHHYLKRHGIKHTAARRKILAAVLDLDGHFEAELVLNLLRQHGYKVGKATVYRTLPLLVDCGIAPAQARMTRPFSPLDSSDWTPTRRVTIVPFMAQATSGAGGAAAVLQRVGYGVVALIVLVGVFQVDVWIAEAAEAWEGPFGELMRRGSVLPLFFVGVLSCGGVELSRLLQAQGGKPYLGLAHGAIAALLLIPWLSGAGWLGSDPAELEGFYWEVVGLVVIGVVVGVQVVARRNPAGALRDVGATVLLVFYLGFLGSFGLQLRCGLDIPRHEGAWLLLVVILVTKVSDIGAYFVGSAIGRHKLFPTISPAKTVEGAIGGLAASAVTAVLFAYLGIPLSFGVAHSATGLPPLARAALFGFALSAAGQVGDLLESCFKRDVGIKDSGKVIPRFGGILDLIDSPMLAMPVGWFLLTGVWDVV